MSTAGLKAGAKVITGAVRKPSLSPARVALIAVVAVFLIAVLRVVTGANDLASSGALAAAIGLAVPIGMAGLGGLWSERAGVVNIGLEGMMILGTWGAGFFGWHYGPWAGLLGAMFCGMVGGAIHALATVVFGVDHIVSGVAINIIGYGAAKYLAARTFTGSPGGGPTQSPPLQNLPSLSIPGVSSGLGSLESKEIFFVSDLAAILRALVTNLSIVTLIALAMVALTWWVLWRTTFGLRLRSCGESPVAAESLGVNVFKYKFIAVLVSGSLAGLGGGYLALVAANIYRDGQTGGRGYIGLGCHDLRQLASRWLGRRRGLVRLYRCRTAARWWHHRPRDVAAARCPYHRHRTVAAAAQASCDQGCHRDLSGPARGSLVLHLRDRARRVHRHDTVRRHAARARLRLPTAAYAGRRRLAVSKG